MFVVIIIILSAALVMVSVRFHVYYKRSVQPATQPTTEVEYDDVIQRNTDAVTEIEMKHNKAYREPRQNNNRVDDREAIYEVIAS